MNALLYKELRLVTHPTTIIFMTFVLMVLIPDYPLYIAYMYMGLSILYLFLNGRETKDVLYTVLLPIPKKDIVLARVLFVALVEAIQIILTVPVVGLRLLLLGPENLAGIDPNLAFFGLALGMFGVFNAIFIPLFYRTAYKVGGTFLLASLGMLVYFSLVEGVIWLGTPVGRVLDAPTGNYLLAHSGVFLGGFLAWGGSLVWAYRAGARAIEKVDI